MPEVAESIWWRSPALKVGGKGFARLRAEAADVLVSACDLAEKEAPLVSGDPACYTTPHYDGDADILIGLDRVRPPSCGNCSMPRWWLTAPAKVRELRARDPR
ncbi:hypothetical protein IFM12275_03630 [Nocardia sputorum]|uniref:hypothetical protein n=1 Tax=Nocardia TaxID=1817 RepID=UPI00248F8012|nr:hypothetical protein [Nocardia sputorum]BDT90387.1 hypothetical protein IFM12275_03630 [Nocardia sputorum]